MITFLRYHIVLINRMKHITITVGRISDMILRGGEEQRMVANLSPPPLFFFFKSTCRTFKPLYTMHKIAIFKRSFLSLSTDKIISKWVFCHLSWEKRTRVQVQCFLSERLNPQNAFLSMNRVLKCGQRLHSWKKQIFSNFPLYFVEIECFL